MFNVRIPYGSYMTMPIAWETDFADPYWIRIRKSETFPTKHKMKNFTLCRALLDSSRVLLYR
jgi:hypothetical protein